MRERCSTTCSVGVSSGHFMICVPPADLNLYCRFLPLRLAPLIGPAKTYSGPNSQVKTDPMRSNDKSSTHKLRLGFHNAAWWPVSAMERAPDGSANLPTGKKLYIPK